MGKIRGPIGGTYTTARLNYAMSSNPTLTKQVQDAFRSYRRGNWGDTCAEDSVMNDMAAANPGTDRIFASYDTCEGRIFIITEWDRSITTLLFANEY